MVACQPEHLRFILPRVGLGLGGGDAPILISNLQAINHYPHRSEADFKLYDTVAVLAIGDDKLGNYGGPYRTEARSNVKVPSTARFSDSACASFSKPLGASKKQIHLRVL